MTCGGSRGGRSNDGRWWLPFEHTSAAPQFGLHICKFPEAMFGSLDPLALFRRRNGAWARDRQTVVGAERERSETVRMWRYLPLAAIATGSVVVLPGAVMAALVPLRGIVSTAVCAALAPVLSVAAARAEAAVWARQPRSRDILFADLMLWRWGRRCWTERRLAQARDLYESARKAGPGVSMGLLQDLSERLEARDVYTHGHSRRVSRHAGRIAKAMRLSPTDIAKIRTAATVHDVGKLHTPREILNNPGRLTDREFEIVKLHPGDGADMLAEVGDPEIAAMVRHHHERIDGGGYPDGLTGSEIPLGARIIAVADTFDAITSGRPYRRAGTHRKALDILSREAGSQLDGAAVAAFLGEYSPSRSLALLAFAAAIPERIFAGLQAGSASLGGVGTTAIIPAVGAAGLFAFTPGLHQGTPIDRISHAQPTIVSPRVTVQAAPTRVVTTRAGRVGGTRPPTTHAHHGNRGALPTSPGGAAPRRTSSGKHPSTPSRGGSSEPTAPVTTQPATPPPPPPTKTTTTPETPPPAVEVPTLPEPPVSLPVKVPSVPGVPLPGVK
jgi:HD-GYP domain-containing protein (c-di-GMP phosphodiesterase class II)